MENTLNEPGRNKRPNTVNLRARAAVEEMKSLLAWVIADRKIKRSDVITVAEKARALAADPEDWPGGEMEVHEYLGVIGTLEQQILHTLDFRRLRDEGLLRAVSF